MSEPVEEGRRVPHEELDFDENLIYFHNRVRFTGIGYEDSPVRGLSEISYRDGYQDGPSRDWYPSGTLKVSGCFTHRHRPGGGQRQPQGRLPPAVDGSPDGNNPGP